MVGSLLVLWAPFVPHLVAATSSASQNPNISILSHASGRKLSVAVVPCNGHTEGPNGYPLDENCHEINTWYVKAGHSNDGNEGNEGNEGTHEEDFFDTPANESVDPNPSTEGPATQDTGASCDGHTVGPNDYELDENCEEKGNWYVRAGHSNDGNEGNEGNEGAHEENFFDTPANNPVDPTPEDPPSEDLPTQSPEQQPGASCDGYTNGPNDYELDENCEEKGKWYIRAGHSNDGNEGNEGNEGAHEENYFNGDNNNEPVEEPNPEEEPISEEEPNPEDEPNPEEEPAPVEEPEPVEGPANESPYVIGVCPEGAWGCWGPAYGWHDSYSIGGKCYCHSDHWENVQEIIVPGPDNAMMTVQEVCELIGEGPETVGNEERVYYNTVQCGHSPTNGKPDEGWCPGRVPGPGSPRGDKSGCGVIGPKWTFD